MASALKSGGFKVDRPSQKMLLALNKRDGLRGSSLRKTAELSQNTQVFYRMEEHLIPAGLVEEQNRRHEQDQRRFSLTDGGASWLDAHEEVVAMPKSRVETQEMAHEALEEASSAKDSVQSYRQKVNRIKNDVEDVEDEWVEWQKDKDDAFSKLFFRTSILREDSDDQSDSIEEIECRVSDIEAQREEYVRNMGNRVGKQEKRIEALQSSVSSLEKENAKLWAEIEKMKRGPMDRFRDWSSRDD